MNDEILKELKYNSTLLEAIRSQNQVILEGQKDQARSIDVRQLQQDVTELKQDVKTIKETMKATNDGLKATNRDLSVLGHRVTRLEAA